MKLKKKLYMIYKFAFNLRRFGIAGKVETVEIVTILQFVDFHN